MKKILSIIVVAAMLTGCAHLPSFAFHPAEIKAPANPTAPSSPEQSVVDWEATLLSIAGVAGIGFGAFCIYTGLVPEGIKFIAGGLALPIFAVFFASHWGVIVGIGLLAVAGLEISIPAHLAFIKNLLTKIKTKI
jgi:hypothetical protein